MGVRDLRQLPDHRSRRAGPNLCLGRQGGRPLVLPRRPSASLQGLGPDGCEFVICFDDGKASQFNTLLVTDWLAHTPPHILAKNFGLPADTFAKIPLQDLYIFQGKAPGSLAADRAAVLGPERVSALPVHLLPGFDEAQPARPRSGEKVRIADSNNFKVWKNTLAAALVTVHPGGMREMHWHPNADEWQYWIKGKGRMTVFNTGPNALTMDFNPGDIGYVKRNLGHYMENVGDTDMVVLEVFRSSLLYPTSPCPTGWRARRRRWSPST